MSHPRFEPWLAPPGLGAEPFQAPMLAQSPTSSEVGVD